MKRAKRLFVVIMTVILLAGCGGIYVSPDAPDTLLTVTAIKMGGEFARKNPGDVPLVIDFGEKFLAGGTPSTMLFDTAREWLAARVASDPVDQACLEAILSMIIIQETGEINAAALSTAVDGFLLGVKMGMIRGS